MKRIICAVLALIMVICAAGCGGNELQKSETDSAADKGVRVFTDDCGREIEVPESIDRILPSGAFAQIILFAFAPDKLVGLANKFSKDAGTVIPEKYLNIPYYGAFYGSKEMNLEELAKSDAQVVIDIGDSLKDQSEELDSFTQQSGIPIVHIYCDLAHTGETMKTLGSLLGMEERGCMLAEYFDSVYDRAVKIMEKVGDNKVRAMYVMGEEGLNVIAKGSYHSEILDMFVENAAAIEEVSNKGLGNEVSMEQIAVWNPDFIFFKDGSIYSEVSDKAVWKDLNAIKSGKFVECPSIPDCWLGMPPSIQRYLALIWIPALLYPDYVDYEAETEIKKCYKMIYGIELEDAQFQKIVENAYLK